MRSAWRWALCALASADAASVKLVGWHLPHPLLKIRTRAPGTIASAIPQLDATVVDMTSKSMQELLVSCGIGYAATRSGLIDGTAISSLAKIVFNVFLPCMLCSSVAATVAQGGVRSLLLIPVAAQIQVALGLLIGTVSVALLRLPRYSPAGRGIAVLSGFGNSGVLPLIFVSSLFRDTPSLRQRANSLVAMYLLGWSPLFWTVGFALLTGMPSPGQADEEESRHATGSQDATSSNPGRSFKVATKRSVAKQLRLLHAGLSRAISPPIIGCLVGLVVGITPILRSLLLPSSSGAAPILPLYSCLERFGLGYSPAALLVLAGSLAAPTKGEQPKYDELGHSYMHVLTITIARFLLVPLCSFGVLHTALRLRLLPVDPLRDFVLLLQSCMPSAQNSVLALQVAGNRTGAARMARVLLAIYLVAAVPVAGTLSVLLQRYSMQLGQQL